MRRHSSQWQWTAWDWTGGVFPTWPRGRFFGPGQLRLAILSLLADGPRHGYDLMKEFETRSHGAYRLSAGTLYPTLQQLEDEGFILSERRDGKRVYELTEEGRRELEREAETVAETWRRLARCGDWARWVRPETVSIAGPVGTLAKTVFEAAAKAAGDPARRARIEEILERAKREIQELSAQPSG